MIGDDLGCDFPICARIYAQMGKNKQNQRLMAGNDKTATWAAL